MDNMTVEMFLIEAGLTFPHTLDMLNDPSVWIANAGASFNSTRSYVAMMNRQISKVDDGITLVGGRVKGTTIIGNISGTVCSKNETKLLVCKIENVKY
eukprot:12441487-Ditylum_brightwellii.AAC.1